MNTHDHRARAKRGSGELNVQNIYGIFAQFRTEYQRNSDEWGMRKSGANFEIGPTFMEPFARLAGGYVNNVFVDAVDLGQRLDEINGVAFVASKLRPNRMSVDCDPQSRNPVIIYSSRPKPGPRHSDANAYRARGCVRPYRAILAGSRAWLF